MFKINENSMIYIFCTKKMVSGGPEALHQLRYYLENLGYQAYIVYDFTDNVEPTIEYKKYMTKVKSYKDIIDSKNNVLIVPETKTNVLSAYYSIRKAIWFLGYHYWDYRAKHFSDFSLVDYLKDFCKHIVNFFLYIIGSNMRYCLTLPYKKYKKTQLLCGSKYAYDRLKNERHAKNVELLVEPISMDFLESGVSENNSSLTRGNVILYNPGRPSDIQDKLIERGKFCFLPLKGYTPKQLINLYRKSKLYVDFGEFSGPERIPKEAVFNGTCILVANHNAAVNNFDVAIPKDYKIDPNIDIQTIEERIEYILNNYDKCVDDFSSFRNKISLLAENFTHSIKGIFLKNE